MNKSQETLIASATSLDMYMMDLIKEALDRIAAQEQAHQADQKFWADEIYTMKQKIGCLASDIKEVYRVGLHLQQRIEKLEKHTGESLTAIETNTKRIENLEKEIEGWKKLRKIDQKMYIDHQRIEKLEKFVQNFMPDALNDYQNQLRNMEKEFKNLISSLSQQNSVPKVSQSKPTCRGCANTGISIVGEQCVCGQSAKTNPKISQKPKFEIGDRIAVYSHWGREVGEISGIDPNGMIYFTEEGFTSCHNDSPFHPKQCRKLKKKVK